MEAILLLCVIAISLVACDPLYRNIESDRTVTKTSESDSMILHAVPIINQSPWKIKNVNKVRIRRSIAVLYINGKKVCPIERILIGNECLTCEDINYEDDRCS